MSPGKPLADIVHACAPATVVASTCGSEFDHAWVVLVVNAPESFLAELLGISLNLDVVGLRIFETSQNCHPKHFVELFLYFATVAEDS